MKLFCQSCGLEHVHNLDAACQHCACGSSTFATWKPGHLASGINKPAPGVTVSGLELPWLNAG